MNSSLSTEDAVSVAVARTGPRGAAGKRLLLLKFGAIGDVVMAIPAAARMAAAGYAVDWVAGESVAPILRLYPWIRVVPVNEQSLLRGGAGQRLKSLLGLWREIRRCGAGSAPYDLCATLYYDRRYRVLTLPIRARRRISLSRMERATRLLPGRHHTDEYARILMGEPDGEAPEQLAPVPPPEIPPSGRPPQPGRPRVVLVPAGARNLLRDDALRRWPVDHYLRLAEELVRRGYEVVLAGGPEDRWASPHFADLGRNAAPGCLEDSIGDLSLLETLSLLHSAEVTVTHDTGPLHMAGITATGIVSLFGPTDPRGRLPQRPNSVALWGGEGFACRPCYDGVDYAACRHNGCMHQVAPEMVLAEVERMLKTRVQGSALPPRVLTPGHTDLVQVRPAGDALAQGAEFC